MEGLVLVVVIVGALLIGPFATMLLWNWLMPHLFGLPEIGFCEAAGLMLLVGLLTGFFSGGGSSKE